MLNVFWKSRTTPGRVVIIIALLYSLGLILTPAVAPSIFQETMKKAIGKAGVFAQEYLDVIKSKDVKKVSSLLMEDIRSKDLSPIKKLVNDFETLGELKKINIIGYNMSVVERAYDIAYVAEYEKQNMLIRVNIRKTDDRMFISGFNYNGIDRTYKDIVRFPLWGMPAISYILLFIAMFVVYYSFATLIRCVESDVKLKWLWAIFIIIGFFSLSVAWEQAAFFSLPKMEFKLIAVHLLSAGLNKLPVYNPWVITIALPVGAIVFNVFVGNAHARSKKDS